MSSCAPQNWNPLAASAWYWSGPDGELRRWLAWSFLGHVALIAAASLLLLVPGCRRTYDLVKGSGKPNAMIKIKRQYQVVKQTRRKILVNPASPILFEVPPLETVNLQLKEDTRHDYSAKVGQGEGEGPAGYAAGKEGARFIFMRVRYQGGNWDYNLRNGADENMAREFGRRTQIPVSPVVQDVTLLELGHYVRGKAPPLVYLVGATGFTFDGREARAVRQYLFDNHGMILGDNGGNAFHYAFLGFMQQVAPELVPVEIPDDDLLYQAPYALPGCPPLWAHSGTRALGWKKDGRWIVVYHQGSLSDAWKDTHGGTSTESAELAYALGVNILQTAMASYSEWKLSLDGKPTTSRKK
jgi:hypothetical protein